MRFLADENFPGGAVTALRSNGYDIEWIRTLSPGISDPEVLKFAQSEDRVLLTFDKEINLYELISLSSANSSLKFNLHYHQEPFAEKVASFPLSLLVSGELDSFFHLH
jgi:uncharacterized protein with PIN domain